MKTPQELHNEFVGYRAYCKEFLSHKRRNRFMARWMPAERVACPCRCGDFWMDDLSETNWLAKVLSIKTFFVMIYHLHQVVKAIHGVVWSAVAVCWIRTAHSSRDIRLLFYSSDHLEKRVSLYSRIWFLVLTICFWGLSRLGGPIFLAGFFVALAIAWAVLSLALILNAAMLLPFATSLIIGLAAGYFLEGTHGGLRQSA